MKTLKVVLLTGRVDSDRSYAPGDKLTLPIREAVSLIKSEQAKPVSEEDYEAVIVEAKKEQQAELEKQAEVIAVENKQKLKAELRELYTQVVLKVAEIEGVVLSDDEINAQVDEIFNGTSVENNTPEGQEDKSLVGKISKLWK